MITRFPDNVIFPIRGILCAALLASTAPCLLSQTQAQLPSASTQPKPAATMQLKPAATVLPKPAATVQPKPAATVLPKPVELQTQGSAPQSSGLPEISKPTPKTSDALTATSSPVAPVAPATTQELATTEATETVAAPDERDVETILRLQVFLDRRCFGPGKVDGKLGEFTRKAVDCYNTTIGLKPADYSAVLRECAVIEPLAQYTVAETDFAWVDAKLPTKPEKQVKSGMLRYRSLAEFIAERYHTDENWLHRANPLVDFTKLKAGDAVKVPNVVPFTIESLPRGFEWQSDPVLSARTAVVDTQYKFACIYEGSRMVAAFPITPGQEKFIRRGDWKLLNMRSWPAFRWDKSMLETGKRSETYYMLPPGPNSPVGVLWAGLNRSGIGMHGTSTPETIGRARSAGCFRLANWDVIRLPDFIRPGAAVVVR